MDKPKSLTGGCLCGSVRYEVTFPEDHDFENASSTCQCTQCRKCTGTLYFHDHSVPVTSVRYTSPTTTLRNYQATPGCLRGFCSECGSFLYWRKDGADEIGLAVGCFDEEFLVGDAQAETTGGTDGKARNKGFGIMLVNPKRHFYCINQVEGVTDKFLHGLKWERGSEHGVILTKD